MMASQWDAIWHRQFCLDSNRAAQSSSQVQIGDPLTRIPNFSTFHGAQGCLPFGSLAVGFGSHPWHRLECGGGVVDSSKHSAASGALLHAARPASFSPPPDATAGGRVLCPMPSCSCSEPSSARGWGNQGSMQAHLTIAPAP